MATQIGELIELIDRFRDERNWRQFHNPKDLSLSLVLEATELLEHFQWKNGEAVQKYLDEGGKDEVRKEMADVFVYLLQLASDLDIDLDAAVREKMVLNGLKYPVEKATGSAVKYDKLAVN